MYFIKQKSIRKSCGAVQEEERAALGAASRLGGDCKSRQFSHLVGQVGIEPTANRLKAYCSTTELPTQVQTLAPIVRKLQRSETEIAMLWS